MHHMNLAARRAHELNAFAAKGTRRTCPNICMEVDRHSQVGSVSWQRSPTVGRDDPAPEHFEIYSEDRAEEPPVPDGSSGGRSLELWRCWHCAGDTFMANQSGWICSTCGADEFYNARHHQQHETRHGVWMYLPNQPSEDLTPPEVPGPPAIGRPTTSNRGPPSSFGVEAGETAESERPTKDPSIDPDTMQPTPRRQRPRRRARARGEPGAPDGDVGDRPPALPEDTLPHEDSGQPHQDAIQQLVTALNSLNKHKDKKGNQSGTASMGLTPRTSTR